MRVFWATVTGRDGKPTIHKTNYGARCYIVTEIGRREAELVIHHAENPGIVFRRSTHRSAVDARNTGTHDIKSLRAQAPYKLAPPRTILDETPAHAAR